MNERNIQSRAHACQACEKGFSDKQPYHTVLSELKHQIERRDLCEPCWTKEQGEGIMDRQGFISHWQGIYEAPPAAPPEAIQKENAETLLRKIVERNDPAFAAAAYILAAMLERPATGDSLDADEHLHMPALGDIPDVRENLPN